jgi:hypothetical protein
VQANHVAPQGAKYSEENARKEKEQSRVSFPFASNPKKHVIIDLSVHYQERKTAYSSSSDAWHRNAKDR